MKISRQELLNQLFRNGLYLTFASEGIPQKKNEALGDEFDKLTDTGKMSGEGAAGIIYAAYGSQNARVALDKIKVFVQDQLVELGHEKANHFGSPVRPIKEASGSEVSEYIGRQLGKLGKAPAVETDSKKRFAALLKKINADIDKCSIEVNSQDLTEFARAQSKLKIAPCFEQVVSHTAVASHTVGGKEFQSLCLEIIGQ